MNLRRRLGLGEGNWHRIYYLLALFDVLTVAGGLLLTHRITVIFRDAVAVNQRWAHRLDAYSALGTLASDVNAPGNDVFDTVAIDFEERRLAKALASFNRATDLARREAENSLTEPARSLILADLDAVAAADDRMVAEARRILEYFRRQEPALAGRRMATMDRRYADLNGVLAKLRQDAIASAVGALDEQERAANALRRYQVVIGLAILLMVVAATAYGHNISVRTKAEAAQLTETTRRLQKAQRMARLGSWDLDLRTQEVTWSDEMFRLLGFEPGEIVPTSETYLGLLHPDDREISQTAVARSVETGEPFERDDRVVRRDGSERIFRAAGDVITNDKALALRMVGTVQDVTDLRAAETAVRRSEERFQFAARATNDALWDWDVEGGTVWWNEGFHTLFGHANPAPSIDFRMALIHPDDATRIGDGVHAFLESTSEFWTDEYRFKRADGSYAWVFDRGFAIRDDAGHAIRMIGSMMDITERKQSERMKSDFVSFVSHQLRTPLSGMSWMLELADDTPGIPEEARAHLADARESATRLATLVNDLLDIAKLESGRLGAVPERLPLGPLTESVVAELQPLAAGKALALEVQYDPLQRPVFADRQLVRQVLTNLVSNAVKYTPSGGRIAITLSHRNGSVTWSVRDTGVGVPKGAQPRLFEKFFRADNAILMDAEGTGLGLHLVRLIVEQAGGHIWCESEEGQGATFAFTLPAMAADEEAK